MKITQSLEYIYIHLISFQLCIPRKLTSNRQFPANSQMHIWNVPLMSIWRETATTQFIIKTNAMVFNPQELLSKFF